MKNLNIHPEVIRQSKKLIGEFFRNRRAELGYTQRDLAEMINVRQATISDFESGEKNYEIDTLLKCCVALKIQPFFEEK